MTQEELLAKLHTLTRIECFYREYYLARQSPQILSAFLAAMDIDFIEKHR